MTQEQQRVRDWMKAFGQDCPTQPTIPSLEIRKLRAKLILEEALETIKGLGLDVYDEMYDSHLTSANNSFRFEEGVGGLQPNLIDIIDGCEDLKVVTEGTLVACGCTPENLGEYGESEDLHFNEVMRANEGKLWTEVEVMKAKPNKEYTMREINTINAKCFLVKDTHGKIIKPPSFTPPDHQSILEARVKEASNS